VTVPATPTTEATGAQSMPICCGGSSLSRRRRIAEQVPLGQPHRADVQRSALQHLDSSAVAEGGDDFRGATTDVDDQGGYS
jgi:hypothetical protein